MMKDSLQQSFALSQMLLTTNIEGITHEESLRSTSPGNCINWLLGHILICRQGILKILGGKAVLSDEQVAPYQRGSAALTADADCLHLDALLEGLSETADQVQRVLIQKTDNDMTIELQSDMFPVPVQDHRLGAWLTFMLCHETYHIGQIGIARRQLDKPGAIA